jgi:pilus assembly protein Flp/PilA
MMKFKKYTQKGATLVEYGMVLAIISATSVTVISTIGEKVNAAFSNVNTLLSVQAPAGDSGTGNTGASSSGSNSTNGNASGTGHGYAYGLGNGNGHAYAYGHSN